jgi:hypothetical protein
MPQLSISDVNVIKKIPQETKVNLRNKSMFHLSEVIFFMMLTYYIKKLITQKRKIFYFEYQPKSYTKQLKFERRPFLLNVNLKVTRNN